MADVPHFDLPFRFSTPQAAVVEQDSIEEIAGCVLALLLCEQGFRVELPEYGLLDPTFSSPRVDVEAIRAQVLEWEPRASVILDAEPARFDELVSLVSVQVQVRTEE
jgi:hypothetical protein